MNTRMHKTQDLFVKWGSYSQEDSNIAGSN